MFSQVSVSHSVHREGGRYVSSADHQVSLARGGNVSSDGHQVSLAGVGYFLGVGMFEGGGNLCLGVGCGYTMGPGIPTPSPIPHSYSRHNLILTPSGRHQNA